MNKIFILGHEITMELERIAVKRWAVLYCHSDVGNKFSQCRIFRITSLRSRALIGGAITSIPIMTVITTLHSFGI